MSANKNTLTDIQAIEMTTHPAILSVMSSMDDYSSTRSVRTNRCQQILAKLRERPWFIWLISLVEIIIFIVELGINWSFTGSPIQIKPSFNPLIGPSTYVLIHMGARFAPCMYAIKEIINDDFLRFPCPNYTGSIDQDSCSLNELCGFGGVSSPPNQWYRFIIPIFLHGGLLHLAVNVFTQLIMGISVEKKMGSCRFAIIYFVSGIFGNIVSANFAPNGSASVGSSGSLFGIIALFLLNLILDWHNTSRVQLICFIIGIVIDLGLGLLPIVDNFAHIGGFIMGLLLGIALSKPPSKLSLPVANDQAFPITLHERLPKFCQNRPRKWWFWWLLRFGSLGMVIVLLVLSMLNIYLWNIKCNWCQYINCLPIKDWCDNNQLGTGNTANSTLTTGLADTSVVSTRSQ